MSAFVLTMFWLYVLVAFVRFVYLIGEHPRKERLVSVGEDTAGFIVNLAIMVWAAYLTWGG